MAQTFRHLSTQVDFSNTKRTPMLKVETDLACFPAPLRGFLASVVPNPGLGALGYDPAPLRGFKITEPCDPFHLRRLPPPKLLLI